MHRKLNKRLTPYDLYLLLNECTRTGKIPFTCYQSWYWIDELELRNLSL